MIKEYNYLENSVLFFNTFEEAEACLLESVKRKYILRWNEYTKICKIVSLSEQEIIYTLHNQINSPIHVGVIFIGNLK